MSCRDLLFELGTEELPASELLGMAHALAAGIESGLQDKGLAFGDTHVFATPRRLAVLVQDVAQEAPEISREQLGPPVASAHNPDGSWSRAALGFAQNQGVAPESLVTIDTDKGPRLAYCFVEPGAQASTVIPQIIAAAVTAIPVSKRMRWNRHRCEFLRPVQWLVLLFGSDTLPLSLYNLEAGRTTRGHRFHHPQPIVLTEAGAYEAALLDGCVIADFAARRTVIIEQIQTLAESDRQPVIGDDLLHEVTGLVEWPCALLGQFDASFLDVPAAALISSMKSHQKYFHCVDASGALAPSFITIANLVSREPDQIVAGNERVIRPRLSDAAFFFANDKQTALADRMPRLASVVFQNKLGSLADKGQRIAALATTISGLIDADADTAHRAGYLSKCDLVTDMVLEFPELQGIAGAHYAAHDGETDAVCEAIEQHYWPKFAGDQLPTAAESVAVALADRLDTLVGIFGIGLEPTGSKDPFALRRAALAVVRMILAQAHTLSLTDLIASAQAQYAPGVLAAEVNETVTDYILERLRSWYEDQGIGVDLLRAVLASERDHLADIDQRIRALSAYMTHDAALALIAANKRVANILAKADTIDQQPIDPQRLIEPAEQALASALDIAKQAVDQALTTFDYTAALDALAVLREPVDAFFDAVMVNVEDSELRTNRLRLLSQLRELFIGIADVALINPGSSG